MTTKIGTRRCTFLDAVDQNSIWINGLSWVSEDESAFEALTLVNDITLTSSEKEEASEPIQ